jgi:hypothetical protein
VVLDVATLLVGASALADPAVLADEPNNFGDTRSGGLAGPLGLFIILLLAIATVLLIRNMNSRLRRLPDHFPSEEADGRGDRNSDGRSTSTPEGP